MSRYKRNYLTSVIVRADCVSPMPGLDDTCPKAVADALLRTFPISETQAIVKGDIKLTSEGMMAGVPKQSKLWKFFSKNRDKHVELTADSFLVIYDRYRSFSVLKKDFALLTNAVFESFPDITISRLGLRYVDTIDIPGEKNPLSWRKYLKPKLLAIFDVPDDDEKKLIVRALHRLELNYGDTRTIFRYGVQNPDYPSPVKKKQFMVDTDVFREGLTEREDIEASLAAFHTRAKALFEDSITEALRKRMNA